MALERLASPLQLIETCEVGLSAILDLRFSEESKSSRQISNEVYGQPFSPCPHGSICFG